VSPLVYYYLGYFAQAKVSNIYRGDQRQNYEVIPEARHYFELAAKQPIDYVFPFQMEMIPVLEAAMATEPRDPRAPYFLGNLLFDSQPARAQALWEKSVAQGANFPVVYRNLAQVYTRAGGQRDKVLAILEKGVQYGGNAKIFDQLDQLYEENGMAPEKRLALLESHQGVLTRPEIIAREINLAVLCGKPDLGIKLIKSLYFRAWEGGSSFNMGDYWANANLVAGHQQRAAKQPQKALAFYQAALVLPPTLAEEGGGNPGAHALEATYFMGLAYEALGDTLNARQAWTKVSTGNVTTTAPADRGRPGRPSVGGGSGVRVAAADAYFQALAAQKLGDSARAATLFNQLLTTGTQAATQNALPANTDTLPATQRSTIADAHYLIALGNLGLGNKDKAKEELNVALKVSPDHLAAKEALNSIGQ
jgi:tetratricopeptide (TPR) repeat protein